MELFEFTIQEQEVATNTYHMTKAAQRLSGKTEDEDAAKAILARTKAMLPNFLLPCFGIDMATVFKEWLDKTGFGAAMPPAAQACMEETPEAKKNLEKLVCASLVAEGDGVLEYCGLPTKQIEALQELMKNDLGTAWLFALASERKDPIVIDLVHSSFQQNALPVLPEPDKESFAKLEKALQCVVQRPKKEE